MSNLTFREIKNFPNVIQMLSRKSAFNTKAPAYLISKLVFLSVPTLSKCEVYCM